MPITELIHLASTVQQVSNGSGNNLHGVSNTVNHFFEQDAERICELLTTVLKSFEEKTAKK